jgi:hypothetical protein
LMRPRISDTETTTSKQMARTGDTSADISSETLEQEYRNNRELRGAKCGTR